MSIITIVADSVASDTNGFSKFLTSVLGDTRRETQIIKAHANHTMLIPPPTRSTACSV